MYWSFTDCWRFSHTYAALVFGVVTAKFDQIDSPLILVGWTKSYNLQCGSPARIYFVGHPLKKVPIINSRAKEHFLWGQPQMLPPHYIQTGASKIPHYKKAWKKNILGVKYFVFRKATLVVTTLYKPSPQIVGTQFREVCTQPCAPMIIPSRRENPLFVVKPPSL